jgi:hypothetical protein
MKTTISTLLLKMDCTDKSRFGSNSTIDSNQKMIHGM